MSNEHDTYRIEHLLLQIAFVFDSNTASYRIHFTSLADSSSQQQQTNFVWLPEELQTMEQFFNESFFPTSILSNSANQAIMPTNDILSLATVTQSRSTAVGAFEKLLSCIHPRVLRDLVKIIRLEQVNLNELIDNLLKFTWNYMLPYFKR